AGNTINATGAAALVANGVTVGATFDAVTSGGGTNNVSLTNVSGTLAMNGGALSGAAASNAAFLASGGTAAVTYAGTIDKTTTGNLVNVTSKTGGSVLLSGALCSGTCSNHSGISLTNN